MCCMHISSISNILSRSFPNASRRKTFPFIEETDLKLVNLKTKLDISIRSYDLSHKDRYLSNKLISYMHNIDTIEQPKTCTACSLYKSFNSEYNIGVESRLSSKSLSINSEDAAIQIPMEEDKMMDTAPQMKKTCKKRDSLIKVWML